MMSKDALSSTNAPKRPLLAWLSLGSEHELTFLFFGIFFLEKNFLAKNAGKNAKERPG
jgi:hypothetical protein